MKKNIIKSIPCFVGLIYLAFSLFNVESWVKGHLGYEGAVILPMIIAAVLTVVYVSLRIFAKKRLNFYLPVFYFSIGVIIDVVAANIPCCIGR